jgi:hypothetical protein
LLLQSALEINYTQASEIIEKMEYNGVVSEVDFHGKRSVLITVDGLTRKDNKIYTYIFANDEKEEPDYTRIILMAILAIFVLSIIISGLETFQVSSITSFLHPN